MDLWLIKDFSVSQLGVSLTIARKSFLIQLSQCGGVAANVKMSKEKVEALFLEDLAGGQESSVDVTLRLMERMRYIVWVTP